MEIVELQEQLALRRRLLRAGSMPRLPSAPSTTTGDDNFDNDDRDGMRTPSMHSVADAIIL